MFDPRNVVDAIHEPETTLPFPINSKLINIYQMCKRGENISALIEQCKTSYLKLERMIVRKCQHDEKVRDAATKEIKETLDDSELFQSEFYTVIRLTNALRNEWKTIC